MVYDIVQQKPFLLFTTKSEDLVEFEKKKAEDSIKIEDVTDSSDD